MKTVAIIGGKLQGVEAVYLAKKAGMKSLLIDKNPTAPASGFCDEMGVFDVLKKEPQLMELLKKAEFILPALEVNEVFDALLEISEQYGFKLAFDKDAYALTSSKRISDDLMKKHMIPAPKHFPDAGGPYIIKPSEESGSVGVFRAETAYEVKRFLDEANSIDSWIIQEYLEGRSYSIEVIGTPRMYRTYEITEIHMDDEYDCKMVTAPCVISDSAKEEFSQIAIKLAELVNLHGIMDVEVIDHNGTLKVLEIDARIPSQTPMAVYHSSGVNLLAELADITLNGKFTIEQYKSAKGANEESGKDEAIYERTGERVAISEQVEKRKYVAVEHYLIDETGVHHKGERIMGESSPLAYRENFFGAEVALTDYDGKKSVWRGTFINSSESEEGLAQKRTEMLHQLNLSIFKARNI